MAVHVRYNSLYISKPVAANDNLGPVRSTLTEYLEQAKPFPRRGYSQKNWVGMCGPLPKTLTLFMTKICRGIPYPNYELTNNSKPEPYTKILLRYIWILSSEQF